MRMPTTGVAWEASSLTGSFHEPRGTLTGRHPVADLSSRRSERSSLGLPPHDPCHAPPPRAAPRATPVERRGLRPGRPGCRYMKTLSLMRQPTCAGKRSREPRAHLYDTPPPPGTGQDQSQLLWCCARGSLREPGYRGLPQRRHDRGMALGFFLTGASSALRSPLTHYPWLRGKQQSVSPE